jgi:hypothetical protein
MNTEIEKRVALFKSFIDLTLADSSLLKSSNAVIDARHLKPQVVQFTKDITDTANKIVREFVAQNPGEEEQLKKKLTDVIKSVNKKLEAQ